MYSAFFYLNKRAKKNEFKRHILRIKKTGQQKTPYA